MNAECKLCGSDDIKLFYKKSAFNILKCKRCSFVFSDQGRGRKEKKTAASDDSLNVTKRPVQREVEKEIYRSRFKAELKYIQKLCFCKGAILDIGCSRGGFLSVAKEEGWQVQGVEIDQSAVDHCVNKLMLNVSFGVLTDGEFQENYFDVITLFRVLEHVPDFQKTVEIVKKILKSEGLVVIEVPNVSDMRRVITKENWSQFVDSHIWYFKKSTLKLLLEQHGFKAVGFKASGGTEIISSLNKAGVSGVKNFYTKYFNLLGPLKNVINPILYNLGFVQHITVYARKI